MLNIFYFSYLQIKKIEGGERSDSCIVSGIVCTKNIANKAMASRISGPKILLLQCSIIYQRVEGKLLSLEPVIMQVSKLVIIFDRLFVFYKLQPYV